MTKDLSRGVLLSATVFTTVLLLLITYLTGRIIFVFFVLLTFGLAGYFAYLIESDSGVLVSIGNWFEKQTDKIVRLYATS